MKKHIVLITGAAGYIGAMLVLRLAKRGDVETVIGIDRATTPLLIREEKKLVYLNTNTVDDWEEKVHNYRPDIVIHAAWQIREMFGARDMQWRWNISGSDKVFQFCFSKPYVTRLIYLSSVASYGAYPSNTLAHAFVEDEPLRNSSYRYAQEKKIVEERLREQYDTSDKHVTIAVLRLVSVTGSRGRFDIARFGLQSALTGHVKGSWLTRTVTKFLSFVPVTPKFARQFIHEDDVTALIERAAIGALPSDYAIYNASPPGPIVRGSEIAAVVGKKILRVSPQTVRFVFWCCWHFTRGKIPTAPGSWKTYSYPVIVDGSRVTHELGFKYRYSSLRSFQYTDGEYEFIVPDLLRVHAV